MLCHAERSCLLSLVFRRRHEQVMAGGARWSCLWAYKSFCWTVVHVHVCDIGGDGVGPWRWSPGGLRSGLPYLTKMIELKRRS